MNYSDIQHRFANKQAGKNGRISAGNVRYEGRNYYSYGTVFGQWLDVEKNVVAIFDGSTSTSSSKHKLWKGVFPDDVHVFPLDFGSGYYGWRNCNLVSSYNFSDEDFKEYHRMQMIDHYVGRIYDQIAAINGGTKKGLENVDFKAWDYIEELCSLYKDTSIAKWLKYSSEKEEREVSRYTDKKLYAKEIAKIRATAKQQRKLAKLLKDGERDVHTLTDALFGEGTFKTYWDYCARFRKAADKRSKVESLCERLGIASPYEKWNRGRMDTGLTADQIRKLTAKERVELHLKSIAYKEHKEQKDEREKKYNKNMRNAYKWIVGREPKKESWGGGYENDVHNNCVNKDTGKVYECSGEHIYGFYWLNTSVSFDYDGFRKSDDKEKWIADFYAKCKEVADNRKAIGIIRRIKAHTKEKIHSYDDDVYINDDYLRENTTEAEYAICSEFIRKQDKHYADEEARRRAAEIARIKAEEERKREEEFKAQVKKEQIDACVARGAEGARDLWRHHLTDLYTAEDFCKLENFFYNGNVLLRMNLNKDKVETSKYIKIPVDVCKKMWKIVSKWHENPSCFKEMEIDTKGSGKYTISSYENDILTAGCHKIAYAEMERMYNEIINA